MGRRSRKISRWFALLIGCLAGSAAHAAADRFDYDAVGRLIRRVDGQNLGTDYLYDAAGNIVQVTAPAQPQTPSITSVPLPDFRRNEIKPISLSGTALQGLSIRASHPGIVITQVVQSNSTMSFRMAVSGQVPLGRQDLTLQGAAGSIQVPFNVLPELAYAIEPYPIAVPPDGIARRFSLVFAEPAVQARNFGLSTLAPGTARTNVGQISIASGQTRADFGVVGVAEGTTVLRLSSTDFFEPIEAMVSVYQGAGSPVTFSRPLQLSRGQSIAWPGALGNYSTPVSIRRGTPPWNLVSPATFSAALTIDRGAGPWSSGATETRSVLVIQRWLPWATPNAGGFLISGQIHLLRQ